MWKTEENRSFQGERSQDSPFPSSFPTSQVQRSSVVQISHSNFDSQTGLAMDSVKHLERMQISALNLNSNPYKLLNLPKPQ